MTKVHDDFGTSILGGFGWRRKKTLKIRMTLNDRVFISLYRTVNFCLTFSIVKVKDGRYCLNFHDSASQSFVMHLHSTV